MDKHDELDTTLRDLGLRELGCVEARAVQGGAGRPVD